MILPPSPLPDTAAISIPFSAAIFFASGEALTLPSPFKADAAGEAVAAFAQSVPTEKITYKIWDGFYHETHNEPEKQQVLDYMIDWIETHSQVG